MNWRELPERNGEPDFDNLVSVLGCRAPERPTLFEFYFNERLYSRIDNGSYPKDSLDWWRRTVKTFYRLGYDYATVLVPGFRFTDPDALETKATFSLNQGAVIRSQKDFDSFRWPNPDDADFDMLNRLAEDLPPGMKLIPYSPDGVLENVIRLMGFDDLCYMLIDDPVLVESVFEQIGSRLFRYYQKALQNECVGACLANDDWGFNSSTLLSPEVLQRYVFPWYKRIVEISHAAGKPAILHSCGYFENIIDSIIDDMHFDGRHSYEDKIMPVEDAYERYNGRIAILGGIDIDFLCSSAPEEIFARAKSMLERTTDRGGYALGTGNSVPEYVPDENFFALIRAAFESG